jgi:hypothetical protein
MPESASLRRHILRACTSSLCATLAVLSLVAAPARAQQSTSTASWSAASPPRPRPRHPHRPRRLTALWIPDVFGSKSLGVRLSA